jgi:transcriptional regulator with XRE-family HTH domain
MNTRPFSELVAELSPEVIAQADEEYEGLRREMDLAELRRAMNLSQEEIAAALNIGQPSVAKLEKRADMFVSTLRRFVEAMGGELEIVARFPDHDVSIRNFSDLTQEERA